MPKLLILLVLWCLSCNPPKSTTPRVGEISNVKSTEFKSYDMGYATRYVNPNKYLEFIWKDNSSNIVYRKSRYVNENEIASVLQDEGVTMDQFKIKPIQNKLILEYLRSFDSKNAFSYKTKNIKVYGELQGDNPWRVTWEIDGHERSILDSLFENKMNNDTSIFHFSLRDSLLTLDNWQFEKDNVSKLPLAIKPLFIDQRQIRQNENGTVLALRTKITWGQAITLISELNSVLGPSTLELGSNVQTNTYFWSWNDCMITINLMLPISDNLHPLDYANSCELILFSGSNENLNFLHTQ